jgi:hypothetical protein
MICLRSIPSQAQSVLTIDEEPFSGFIYEDNLDIVAKQEELPSIEIAPRYYVKGDWDEIAALSDIKSEIERVQRSKCPIARHTSHLVYLAMEQSLDCMISANDVYKQLEKIDKFETLSFSMPKGALLDTPRENSFKGFDSSISMLENQLDMMKEASTLESLNIPVHLIDAIIQSTIQLLDFLRHLKEETRGNLADVSFYKMMSSKLEEIYNTIDDISDPLSVVNMHTSKCLDWISKFDTELPSLQTKSLKESFQWLLELCIDSQQIRELKKHSEEVEANFDIVLQDIVVDPPILLHGDTYKNFLTKAKSEEYSFFVDIADYYVLKVKSLKEGLRGNR